MSETDSYLDRRTEFLRIDAALTTVADSIAQVAAALKMKRGRPVHFQ